MSLVELSSPEALQSFLGSNPNVVMTFSAHWCGPCRASKPAFTDMASQYASDNSKDVKFGIVYESDLGDDIHQYKVRAFPTYVMYQSGSEVDRVEGVNFDGIKSMIEKAGCKRTTFEEGGHSLGGGSSAAAATRSPEEARALRLARFGGVGGGSNSEGAGVKVPETTTAALSKQPEGDAIMKEVPKESAATGNAKEGEDVVMMEEDTNKEEKVEDPTLNLDPEAVKNLTESMGFTLIRAQKGLLFGQGGTVEGAVNWLMEHQDDANIDDPLSLSEPLTAEEKAAKVVEIKELLKTKRAERENAEKDDELEREKSRRFTGIELAKTKEMMQAEKQKRDAIKRKREKQAFKLERERIKAELAKDKAERMANKGKLSSKLGVDGYNPDAIQYGLENESEVNQSSSSGGAKKPKPSVAKIDGYIKQICAYRAGGDGGKCLKVLKAYVGNVADNPDETKFRTINTENKAFKGKVKPFVGAKQLLLALGFKTEEGGTSLVLSDGDMDPSLCKEVKSKLEAALKAY